MFSNVDVLSRDKVLELSARLKTMDVSPSIIALQEVKPKRYRFERISEEYKLDEYESVECNISNEEGRGMLMYIKKGISYNVVDLGSGYCEYCCIEVFCGSDTLLITSVYRSPSSDEDNNKRLFELFHVLSNRNENYKVIVGDYNFPHINWSNLTSSMGHNNINTQFIELIRDCYLTQHIKVITRMRGEVAGNTLDLLFSNEESVIEDVQICSPLGKSDHACISFICDIQEVEYNSRKTVYMYEKANYLLMKQRLNIDWPNFLGTETDTETKWTRFKNKLQDTVSEGVPKRQFRLVHNKRKRKNENLPMNRKLWSKIKRKQRLWETMKNMKQGTTPSQDRYAEVELEYRRLNNQVRRETRNAVKKKEQEIARNSKSNPKVFWKYVQSKTSTKAKIGELFRDEEKTLKTTTDKEKADVLSDYFSSTFITETLGATPNVDRKDVPRLGRPMFTKERIREIIKKLKRNKSPGPDELHPRIIKELMEELLEPLSIIFSSSFSEGQVPQDWKVANVTAIYKKGCKS